MTLSGHILGFDFGTRRIGVALANTVTCEASALCILPSEKKAEKWSRIEALLKEWAPCVLVVGIPYDKDGTPHVMTQNATRFARQLQGRYHLPVYTVDERYSSAVVEDEYGKKEGVAIDDKAACIILQQWIDEGMPQRLP